MKLNTPIINVILLAINGFFFIYGLHKVIVGTSDPIYSFVTLINLIAVLAILIANRPWFQTSDETGDKNVS